MRWLVIALTLISLVSVAQADITFDTAVGPANGATFTDPDTGVMATFNWAGGDLGVENLAPFGVASFGTGSLSVFGPADFVNVTFSVPAAHVLTGVSFDVGDFGQDLDEVTVTTVDEFFGINTTTQLMDMPTVEGPFGFTFQNFSYTLGDGFLADGSTPSLLIQGGGPDFINSIFLDNFSFSVVEASQFVAGTDDPTSGLGGDTSGQNLTGDGSLPTTGDGTIPEPSALALLAAGLAALALRRRR